MNLDLLKSELDTELVRIGKLSADVNSLRIQRSTIKKSLREAQGQANDLIEARTMVQVIAKRVQRKTYNCLAAVVTRCLRAVFDEPYLFKMEFLEKRGKTEIELKFVRSGESVDPISASGGGVVDVASFALRLGALLLAGPKTAKVLILDEPFKFVSEEYRSRVSDLLVELSRELHVQIIMVTHLEEFKVGKVVSLFGE